MLIRPITLSDVTSFHHCLDTVARERLYLALFEAPPLAATHEFVAGNLARGVPQVVAVDGDRVLGWCDIQPGWAHALRHCGQLGMGLLPESRGRGLGTALLQACLARAAAAGISRVELEVRADNSRAHGLYERQGFVLEGRKARGMKLDETFVDTLMMSLLLNDAHGAGQPPAIRP